jgi:hypothetical protein
MAKITLEFDSIEEADDARDALDGYKWKLAMWDLDQSLREQIKYNDKLPSKTAEVYEEVRDKIREILSSYNINLE